jgi:hypothetical protein
LLKQGYCILRHLKKCEYVTFSGIFIDRNPANSLIEGQFDHYAFVDYFIAQNRATRRDIMKVLVYFKSGVRQEFIVPQDISAVDFRRVAEAVGGPLQRVEFIHKEASLQKLRTFY